MHIKLWNPPFNGGWIWFNKKNIKRFSCGWIKEDRKLWWAVLGFSGSLLLQTPPLNIKYGKVISWLKYRNHPCYLGFKDGFDHDLESHQDSYGDGVFTMSYSWVECARCGATHEDDPKIPEFPEDDYYS